MGFFRGGNKAFQVIPQRRKIIDSAVWFLRIIPDEVFHEFTIEDIQFIDAVDMIVNKLLLYSTIESFH